MNVCVSDHHHHHPRILTWPPSSCRESHLTSDLLSTLTLDLWPLEHPVAWPMTSWASWHLTSDLFLLTLTLDPWPLPYFWCFDLWPLSSYLPSTPSNFPFPSGSRELYSYFLHHTRLFLVLFLFICFSVNPNAIQDNLLTQKIYLIWSSLTH